MKDNFTLKTKLLPSKKGKKIKIPVEAKMMINLFALPYELRAFYYIFRLLGISNLQREDSVRKQSAF